MERCLHPSICSQAGCALRWCSVTFLFAVYVDDLIYELETTGVGRHVATNYISVIMYADHDILLMSASVSGLQCMLDICHSYGCQTSIVLPRDAAMLARCWET